jgi:hypothetical protein
MPGTLMRDSAHVSACCHTHYAKYPHQQGRAASGRSSRDHYTCEFLATIGVRSLESGKLTDFLRLRPVDDGGVNLLRTTDPLFVSSWCALDRRTQTRMKCEIRKLDMAINLPHRKVGDPDYELRHGI